ncbi:hypothetical protein FACS1894113_3210 [Alphaproteobacteria bacterium]|nr:hypothetical protein FACS1894113_3210 [Alphaproteobacteria bacterium]
MKNRYNLEVSSPGINRPLVKKGDFERFVGKHVVIKTYIPYADQKMFKGMLFSAMENGIELRLEGPSCDDSSFVSFSYADISSAYIDGVKQ